MNIKYMALDFEKYKKYGAVRIDNSDQSFGSGVMPASKPAPVESETVTTTASPTKLEMSSTQTPKKEELKKPWQQRAGEAIANKQVSIVKDILGIGPNKKDTSFVGGLFQSTVGSRGLAGVAQLPGRVIGERGRIGDQIKLNKQSEEIYGQAANLLKKARTEKDPAKQEKYRALAKDLVASADEVMGASSKLGEYETTAKQALGTTLNAGLTVAAGKGPLNPKLNYNSVGEFTRSAGKRLLADTVQGTGIGAASALEDNKSLKGVATQAAVSGAISGVMSAGLSSVKGLYHGITSHANTAKMFQEGLGFSRPQLRQQHLQNKAAAEELIREGGGTTEGLIAKYKEKTDILEDEIQKRISPKEALEHAKKNIVDAFNQQNYSDEASKINGIVLDNADSIESFKQKIKDVLGDEYDPSRIQTAKKSINVMEAGASLNQMGDKSTAINGHIRNSETLMNDPASGLSKALSKTYKAKDVKKEIIDAYQKMFPRSLSREQIAAKVDELPIDLLNRQEKVTVAELNALRREITNKTMSPSSFSKVPIEGDEKLLKAAADVMVEKVKQADTSLVPIFDKYASYVQGIKGLENKLTSPKGNVNVGAKLAQLGVGFGIGATVGSTVPGVGTLIGGLTGAGLQLTSQTTLGKTTLASALRKIGNNVNPLVDSDVVRLGGLLVKLGIIKKFNRND